MPPETREQRPPDNGYYEMRLAALSQGDIFDDVPLAYPMPATEVVSEDFGGSRQFLSGPLDYGKAMLITPTCNMRAQGKEDDGKVEYAHPVRTLVPVMPLDDGLKVQLNLDASKLGLLKKYDELISYMYLPKDTDLDVPESVALLYMPITLHHDMIIDQRITQLQSEAARQLHRKLVWFATSLLPLRATFTPPMD